MNQSLKTIIALLLVLTFATTLLIGCKNTQSSSTEPDNSTTQPADESDTTEPNAEETEPPRKPGVKKYLWSQAKNNKYNMGQKW